MKITFFACGDIYDRVYTLTLKARQWLNEQGIDFDANFVHADKPTDKDFEDLPALGKNWKILNDAFYKKQIESKLNYDTDICVFCHSPNGTELINVAEPTTIYKMTCCQCIIDSDDAWYYIRHELIHAFHYLCVQQGFPVVDNQDQRQQVANAYYTADNETKQQIEKENLQDILPYISKLKPNQTLGMWKSIWQSVISVLSSLLELKMKNKKPSKDKSYYIDYARQMARKYFVDEKVLCATIEAESSWRPDAKLVNKNGTTDWGICQFNDYWYKDLITPERALNDPEFAIELMAKQFQAGREKDWWAYRGGNYTKFLKNY